MKTDSFWLSALWGRLGAAIILIVGTALQHHGIDVSQQQMDSANSLIGGLISNIHVVIAAAMVIVSKLREQAKTKGAGAPAAAPPASNQSGRIFMRLLLAMFIAASIAAVGYGLMGCAPRQTATAQLIQQTGDPGTIALGTYADAQDAYISAQELYLPYQAIIKAEHPDLNAKIVDYFSKANKILDDWKDKGQVPQNDQDAFRDYLRQISLQAAQALQGQQQK